MAEKIKLNKKGKIRVPANRAEARWDMNQWLYNHKSHFERARNTHFPNIKQSLEQGTRRRRRQRKRDKKILKENLSGPIYADDGYDGDGSAMALMLHGSTMKEQAETSRPPLSHGRRRRRTRMRKLTKRR